MSQEGYIVLLLVLIAVVLFAKESLPIDLVSFGILCVLLVTGILTPKEGLSGLSNPATVTVTAMFVLSAAISKTGIVEWLAESVRKLSGRKAFWGTLLLMCISAGFSGFINNTAAVAILLPVAISLARFFRTSPSRLLMPLSYASILGGTCTLIGTSTNILVDSIATEHGQRPFGMFEFFVLGLILTCVGILFLCVAHRLIPDRNRPNTLSDQFATKNFLSEIVLLIDSPSIGKKIDDSPLVKETKLRVLALFRQGRTVLSLRDTVLQEGDRLRVLCDVEQLKKVSKRQGIEFHGGSSKTTPTSTPQSWIEVIVAPNASIVGQRPFEAPISGISEMRLLAKRQQGRLEWEGIERRPLRGGDSLLLELPTQHIEALHQNRDFVLVTKIRDSVHVTAVQSVLAVGIMAGVISLAAWDIFPIVVSALIGVVCAVGCRLLTPQQAYRAVDWRVIFVLASILPLGIALEKTGSALWIASRLVEFAGAYGPVVLLSGFYLLTSLMTEVLSNNATAVLLTPIAISTAQALGVSPRPFLIAIMFAASASFMTPIGYQTNLLIFGPGNFRFSDFLRVGIPLNIITWVLASVLIPYFWPLTSVG